SNETYRNQYRQILFWLDWLPVRITSFGFMLVGHFSKAMPTWLENLFEINKVPQSILIDVAQKSEDMMVDASDCTAEPCLLVRLAKRNLLLILATAAVLTLFGIIQ
ncbi:MAG: regulatory signaling modulator protein AmpE, partial [Pseudoalteromonas spongiae]